MVFSSPIFLFLFLPVVLGLYFISPGKLKNLFLLVASIFFYAWGEVFFVGVMLASIIINYLAAILINRLRGTQKVKVFLVVAIIANLGLLAFYKYANFLVENLNALLAGLEIAPIAIDPVHLPIGISFFTFQALSYIIDVYRGAARVQKNPINVALYISLFPQLIAGPIVRYHDVARQIIARKHSIALFSEGVQRFIIGFAKKVLIANPLGLVADQIFEIPLEHVNAGLIWLGIFCYSLQIYFDFSGYSDMAIGLGRMFGFRYLENFNYPYISRSVQEFWRRWHISLSNWFRDYLYIPLGGNRCAPWRVYFNLVTVFFLCGLWHGASWNFVIWGLLHGSFLIFERLGLGSVLGLFHPIIRHVYVLLFLMISWVFFRADDLPSSITYLAAMIGEGKGNGLIYHAGLYLNRQVMAVLIIAVVGSTPILPYLKALYIRNLKSWKLGHEAPSAITYYVIPISYQLYMIAIFFVSVVYMASGTYNPFIYFRF
jgi:alginate O-acetyltransferase complex protein AlgI